MALIAAFTAMIVLAINLSLSSGGAPDSLKTLYNGINAQQKILVSLFFAHVCLIHCRLHDKISPPFNSYFAANK